MKRTGSVTKLTILVYFGVLSACAPQGFQTADSVHSAGPFSSGQEEEKSPDIDFSGLDMRGSDYDPDLDPLAVPAPTSKVPPASPLTASGEIAPPESPSPLQGAGQTPVSNQQQTPPQPAPQQPTRPQAQSQTQPPQQPSSSQVPVPPSAASAPVIGKSSQQNQKPIPQPAPVVTADYPALPANSPVAANPPPRPSYPAAPPAVKKNPPATAPSAPVPPSKPVTPPSTAPAKTTTPPPSAKTQPQPTTPAPAPAPTKATATTPPPAKPAAPSAPSAPAPRLGVGQKPIGTFTQQLQAKFRGVLNKGRDLQDLTEYEKTKWTRIFEEMKRVSDIRQRVPTQLLFMNIQEAVNWSKRFDEDGSISPDGAWTIAVKAEAPRHNFSNTSCAEFMSEVLREAYRRAGYETTEDFSASKGNALNYKFTASVTGLGESLVKAGWSVWDASKYRAPVGAILVHTIGQTPSHTFMAAGDDGSLIIDNSAPKGRDLRKLSHAVLRKCYDAGAFFLPPGQIPQPWNAPAPAAP